MPVPAETTSLLKSLRMSLTSCATFQRLVGAADADEASDSVYDRFASDILPEDYDEDDPQPEDSYPRAVLDDSLPQMTRIGGDLTLEGSGTLGAFIEFKQFTAAELSDWYGQAIASPTERDHTIHALNLTRKIADELRALSQTAGCLTITQLHEEVGGLIDPKANNGMNVWVLVFAIHWEGLP